MAPFPSKYILVEFPSILLVTYLQTASVGGGDSGLSVCSFPLGLLSPPSLGALEGPAGDVGWLLLDMEERWTH